MFDQTEVGPLIENFDGDSTMRQIAQESISCTLRQSDKNYCYSTVIVHSGKLETSFPFRKAMHHALRVS